MTPPVGARHGVLLLSCPDAPGIVHAVTGLLLEHGCSIVQSQQFGSSTSRTFYMRIEFARVDETPLDLDLLRSGFGPIADRFGMTWTLADTAQRPRVVIMVSKPTHCLNDLLYRNSIGDLALDIVAVVSNHPDAGRLADSYGVRFRHIPITPETKPQAEAELLALVDTERVELIVLARYMQILSADLCKQIEGRTINIHHSMLPSFKGAKPYHQAHAYGVKFIGATAHYVTADLDEGPIIEQEHIRVDHTLGPAQLEARGRAAEAAALARAVRWHSETRVIIHGRRTVVFS